MKRQAPSSSPRLVEYWLADGRPAGPGISFSLEVELPPPARASRLPLRMTVLSRRKRYLSSRLRMS